MAKVVVTGGCGFIGSHLVDALVKQGHEIHAVDIDETYRPERVSPYPEYYRISITDLDALKYIMEDAECVFHLAALPRVQYSIDHPTESHDINVNGTLTALEAARIAGVKRVVYSSSSAIYGGGGGKLPLSETDPPDPLSPYAAQKYMGEVLCQSYARTYGIETVCLRYFNVYGARLDPNGPYALVMGIFLRQKKAGESLTITGDGTQTRDFTNVSDVVNANLLAAASTMVGKGEVINIGSGKNMSINRLAALFGGPKVYIPPRQGDPHDSLADITRAKELLGWSPTTSIEDGVAKLKQWYLAQE